MHVCMHACMHACMHVCMYVFMYESTGSRQNPQTMKLQAPFCGRSHKGRCCMPSQSPQTEPCSPQTAGASLRPQPQWEVCILIGSVRRLSQGSPQTAATCLRPQPQWQVFFLTTVRRLSQGSPQTATSCMQPQPQRQVPSPQRSPRNHKVTLSLPKTANVYVHIYIYIYILYRI